MNPDDGFSTPRTDHTRPSRLRSGSPPCATACTWRSRYPTRCGACRRTGCRTCSASTAARRPARGSASSGAPAWGCRYARGWWRRTAAASGRRAPGGARHPLHVHPAGGRGCRRCGRPRAARLAPAPRGRGADADPRGRRRPARPALRSGHPRRGGLRPGRDRRPGRAARAHQDAQAAARPAGPGAAGHRRHQADGEPARARGPAGHLHLGLRQGRDRGQGAGCGKPPITLPSPFHRRS